jgi:uncharacterized protein YbcI
VHDTQPSARVDIGRVASAISRQIVQLHARLYGRGPTRAKTYMHEDYALTVLEDIFTPAERTLIRAGKGDHVFTTRRAFKDAVQPDFVAVVEAATGRKVRAFISQVHLSTDSAVELFLFEAREGGVGSDGASADGA